MVATRDYHTKRSKSERERQIPYDITYMWNLKYGTNETIYKIETDSQKQKTDVWLPRRRGEERGGLGVWGWEMQTILLKWINNQVLLYGTGNYIQYPVINQNGKEYFKKEYIYIYVCI